MKAAARDPVSMCRALDAMQHTAVSPFAAFRVALARCGRSANVHLSQKLASTFHLLLSRTPDSNSTITVRYITSRSWPLALHMLRSYQHFDHRLNRVSAMCHLLRILPIQAFLNDHVIELLRITAPSSSTAFDSYLNLHVACARLLNAPTGNHHESLSIATDLVSHLISSTQQISLSSVNSWLSTLRLLTELALHLSSIRPALLEQLRSCTFSTSTDEEALLLEPVLTLLRVICSDDAELHIPDAISSIEQRLNRLTESPNNGSTTSIESAETTKPQLTDYLRQLALPQWAHNCTLWSAVLAYHLEHSRILDQHAEYLRRFAQDPENCLESPPTPLSSSNHIDLMWQCLQSLIASSRPVPISISLQFIRSIVHHDSIRVAKQLPPRYSSLLRRYLCGVQEQIEQFCLSRRSNRITYSDSIDNSHPRLNAIDTLQLSPVLPGLPQWSKCNAQPQESTINTTWTIELDGLAKSSIWTCYLIALDRICIDAWWLHLPTLSLPSSLDARHCRDRLASMQLTVLQSLDIDTDEIRRSRFRSNLDMSSQQDPQDQARALTSQTDGVTLYRYHLQLHRYLATQVCSGCVDQSEENHRAASLRRRSTRMASLKLPLSTLAQMPQSQLDWISGQIPRDLIRWPGI